MPSTFILTATFYENLITRKHAVYIKDEDRIEFRHPVIEEDTGCPFKVALGGWNADVNSTNGVD